MIHNGWVAPYGTQAERSSGARIFHGRDVATPRARPGKCGDRTRWLEKSEKRSIIMPKYVIEREIAGAGKLSSEELRKISAKSCSALQKLGPTIQWVQSYVTDDKVSRSIVYTSHPTKPWFASTPSRAAFPQTRYPRSERSSIRPQPNNDQECGDRDPRKLNASTLRRALPQHIVAKLLGLGAHGGQC